MSILGSGSTHMQGSRRVRGIRPHFPCSAHTARVNVLMITFGVQMRAPAASAAAANARCQKCLQQGHWTYECNQDYVYKSRPTRTQQLLDPKVSRTWPVAVTEARL